MLLLAHGAEQTNLNVWRLFRDKQVFWIYLKVSTGLLVPQVWRISGETDTEWHSFDGDNEKETHTHPYKERKGGGWEIIQLKQLENYY